MRFIHLHPVLRLRPRLPAFDDVREARLGVLQDEGRGPIQKRVEEPAKQLERAVDCADHGPRLLDLEAEDPQLRATGELNVRVAKRRAGLWVELSRPHVHTAAKNHLASVTIIDEQVADLRERGDQAC